ncbi:MAG: hypothetical protein HWQ40_10990 [Nostoc sp. NMS9]|nr:hypothetical protein [Nostoc sp. NMS9]
MTEAILDRHRLDILQNSLTPHPLIPLVRGGQTKHSFGEVGFLFVIDAKGLLI